MISKSFLGYVLSLFCFLVCCSVKCNVSEASFDISRINSDKLHMIIPDSRINEKFEEVLIAVNFNEEIFGNKADFYRVYLMNLSYFLSVNILRDINMSANPLVNYRIFVEITDDFGAVQKEEWVYKLKNFLSRFDVDYLINKSFSDSYWYFVNDFGSIFNLITDKKDLANVKSKYYYEFLTPKERDSKNEIYKFYLFIIRKYNFLENNAVNKEKMDKVFVLIRELKSFQRNRNSLKYDDFNNRILDHLSNIDEIDKICKDLYYSSYYAKCIENKRRYLYEISSNVLKYYYDILLGINNRITAVEKSFSENKLDDYKNLYNLKISYDNIRMPLNFEDEFNYLNLIKKLNSDYKKLIDTIKTKLVFIEDDIYKFNISNNGLLFLMEKFSQNYNESEINLNKKINDTILKEINKIRDNMSNCIENAENMNFVYNKIEQLTKCLEISNVFFNYLNKIPKNYIENNNSILVERDYFKEEVKRINADIVQYREALKKDIDKIYEAIHDFAFKLLSAKHPLSRIESISIIEKKNYKKNDTFYITTTYQARMRGAILGIMVFNEKLKVWAWIKDNGQVGIGHQFLR